MSARDESAPASDWSVYVVRCADGTLYTGVARDVERRFAEHESGAGKCAKYLRGRGPLELALQAPVGDKGVALGVEHRIKRLSRESKKELIAGTRSLQELIRAARDGE